MADPDPTPNAPLPVESYASPNEAVCLPDGTVIGSLSATGRAAIIAWNAAHASPYPPEPPIEEPQP